MADRTVVRKGPVVSFALVALLGLTALGADPDGSNPATTQSKDTPKPEAAKPSELRPYKIKAWVSIDPHARGDPRGRETLIAGWKVLVARFIGAPWQLEISEDEGPLTTNTLDSITPDMVIPAAKGFDKAWMIRIEPSADGFSFAGREFDAPTAQVGLLSRRPASVLSDGPRALLQLSLDIFAAASDVTEVTGKKCKVRVQGSMIPAATPLGQVVSVGSVLRPSRIFYKPDGGIMRLDVIKSTYIVVDQLNAGIASCTVYSALGNPLTTKVVGNAKMVAVGLKPASIPTRLRFTFYNPDAPLIPGTRVEERPAAGYTVVSTTLPNGTPREVGTTDREGRLVLEPGFADGLVNLRLMAAGTEPLSQFPIMPGEMIEEKVMNRIDPRSATVTIESEAFALRDEIIDLIAVRKRLEARMKVRIESDPPNWEEVKNLLEQYRNIPSREALEKRLDVLNTTLNAEAEKNKRSKVKTPTATRLLTEVDNLIKGYLNDEDYNAIFDAYQRGQAQEAANKSVGKALPKAMALAGGNRSNAPGLQGAAGADFAPIGGGFTVAMPGNPNQSITKTPDGSSEIKTYRVVDPVKGAMSVSFWDYPLAISASDIPRVIDAERDRLVAAVPGGKITAERVISSGGIEGKQIDFEGLPPKTGEPFVTTSRILLVNSRIFNVTVTGTKAMLAAAPANEFLNSFRSTMRVAPARPPEAAASAPASNPATSTTAGAKGAIEKAQKKAAEQNKGGETPF